MTTQLEEQFQLLRTFLNNHADAGESTWQESEALEAIYTALVAQHNG